ncbi:MAG: hypothetical protein ING75_03255 [Rhodocyclaceae bacterium]|nr:hypothetical protein [Rhodocyclaceae bacterium]
MRQLTERTPSRPNQPEEFWALLTFVPVRVDRVSFWFRVALWAALAIWAGRLLLLDIRNGEIGASFLHGPLLVFHEAGHVVFMPFGELMSIAGGTLGQLIMPAVLCGALLIKNRDPFGAAIGLWLVGVSFLDIAPYAYDALQPQLTLLGGRTGDDGGPHDWIYLLAKFGLLGRAHGVGYFFYLLGALTLLVSVWWGAWLLWRQRRHLHHDFLLDE